MVSWRVHGYRQHWPGKALYLMFSSIDGDEIQSLLRRNLLSDADFDAFLPTSLRQASRRYWTPIPVAGHAAELFARHGAKRILDVGCGPGKFCVVAASFHRSLAFTGIDHRDHLVDTARQLAKAVRTANAEFRVSNATRVPWSEFDGFYFFNPFEENDFHAEDRLDSTVELSPRCHAEDVLRVSQLLATSRVETVIVTYHGFGGPIPSSYDMVEEEPMGTDVVRVWKKRRAESESWCHLELARGVVRVRGQELRAALGTVGGRARRPSRR